MTRRDFLRSAGGITFLSLVPAGRGVFAAPVADGYPRLPLFTVLPYIQPGPDSTLADGREMLIVAWQTQPQAADFSVDFGPTPRYGTTASVNYLPRAAGKGGDMEARFNWKAELGGLNLGRRYYYRVRGNGRRSPRAIPTRQPRGRQIRFVAVRRQLVRRHQRPRHRLSHLPAEPGLRDELRRQRLRERDRRRVSAVLLPRLQRRRRGAARGRAAASLGAVLHGDRQSRRPGQGRQRPRDRRLHKKPGRAGLLHRDAPAAERAGGASVSDADHGARDDDRPVPRLRRRALSSAWRTTRSTTATRISCASTRTATSIRTIRRCRRGWPRTSPNHDADLEVRRVSPSAVQRRRRALRGAAHARAGAAARGARRRLRADADTSTTTSGRAR